MSSSCVIDGHRRLHPSASGDQEQAEQDQPDDQQVVPVHGAQLDAQPRVDRGRAPRRDSLAAVRPQTTQAADQVQAVQRRSARRRRRSRDCRPRSSPAACSWRHASSWPARKASANTPPASMPARARATLARGAAPTRASCMPTLPASSSAVFSHRIGGSATGRQSRSVDALLAVRAHAHGVGRDEQREERGDDREEHPQADRAAAAAQRSGARRGRRRCPAPPTTAWSAGATASHQTRMPASERGSGDDQVHPMLRPWPTRDGVAAVRRLVLRDEVLLARPARCSRRPSDTRPAASGPSCRAAAACPASATRAWSRATDWRRPACRASGSRPG